MCYLLNYLLFFKFGVGGANCGTKQVNASIGHNSPVLVYAETSTGEQVMLTDVIHAGVMVIRFVICI